MSFPQNECCRGKKDGISYMERKLKRRFERENFCGEKRARVKKMRTPKKKKLKLNPSKDLCSNKLEREREWLLELQRSSDSHLLPSDTSFSEQEDSEDEDAICPAVNCLQPEGDEVRRGRHTGIWDRELPWGCLAAEKLFMRRVGGPECRKAVYEERGRPWLTQDLCPCSWDRQD